MRTGMRHTLALAFVSAGIAACAYAWHSTSEQEPAPPEAGQQTILTPGQDNSFKSRFGSQEDFKARFGFDMPAQTVSHAPDLAETRKGTNRPPPNESILQPHESIRQSHRETRPASKTVTAALPPQVKPPDMIKPSPGVAVYNIAAKKVFLPNGTELEAHSGLYKENYDNPKHVNIPMKGATPPGRYELRLRETSFHGVEALRLIPIDGTDTHGRVGLLAHSYMLANAVEGEPGASNGCVSFENYDAFLQKFKSGEVKYLVVVAGNSPALAFGSSPVTPGPHLPNSLRQLTSLFGDLK